MASQAEAAPPSQEDVSMVDAAADSPAPENHLTSDEQRIRILPGSQETAASFEFKQEDHTLGNALRYIIMKNPSVEFCGYSIPHPSEELMNIRIQTHPGTCTAFDALNQGFLDLMDLCNIVEKKFTVAKDEYMNTMQS